MTEVVYGLLELFYETGYEGHGFIVQDSRYINQDGRYSHSGIRELTAGDIVSIYQQVEKCPDLVNEDLDWAWIYKNLPEVEVILKVVDTSKMGARPWIKMTDEVGNSFELTPTDALEFRDPTKAPQTHPMGKYWREKRFARLDTKHYVALESTTVEVGYGTNKEEQRINLMSDGSVRWRPKRTSTFLRKWVEKEQ